MRALAIVAVTSSGLALAAAPNGNGPRALPGWTIYERDCLACHGAKGDGHGPAAPFTAGDPRAFTSGDYEWRTTPIGQSPTDDDLRMTIRFGARGTSMPAFDGILTPAQIGELIDVVRAFAPARPASATTALVLGPSRAADRARGDYLWTRLGCDKCHGADGHGDGPSAQALREPPYDLTREPLHRPRADDTLAERRRAAALSIATGMAGAGMPGYAGQISDADVWALADRVVALGESAHDDRVALDADAITRDRAAELPLGVWPGERDDEDARVFGAPLAPQGEPLQSLAPAQASLPAMQCARCHAKQAREWSPSLHAGASVRGFPARVHGLADGATCARCHTPLAEQQTGDTALRDEGVTCAACHIRGWVRFGPPRIASSLLAAPGYPLVERGLFERADFCMPCHQLPPRTAVNGKPLLDTYREWLEGPYMRRGIECQSCHMSNREHTWLGVHDRDTFRQAIRLDASAHRADTGVTVVARLTNVGAGHDLPTTPTPAVWLRVELYDRAGHAIEGARDEVRIGRDIELTGGTWQERADTRIAPGESRALARAWSGGRTAEAMFARVTVEVDPDEYYERLYARELAGSLPAEQRTAYERAAARARASHYFAEQRDVPIAVSSSR